jgi:hypothetical protein
MPHKSDKGPFQADIPADAVADALRSVERVAAGEEARDDAVDDLLVADDGLPDLVAERLDVGAELVDLGADGGGVSRLRHWESLGRMSWK